MNPIVQAENVSRFYGIALGLNDVTFSVRRGITGIVGPNGAGKTTMLRLLNGQIRPSSGTLRIFGESPWDNPSIKARLGTFPKSDDFAASLRPLEWLVGLGMISGLGAAMARARAMETLGRVKLPREHWDRPLGVLSKGVRQRAKLAQCLLHEPELLILDEPMNGLDPVGRRDLAVVLKEVASEGRSIVVSSQVIHDLEGLCGEFIVLKWGRILRSSNAARSQDARQRWPEATIFRCESPERLARHLLGEGLIRVCKVSEENRVLQVRWNDPDRFYGDFHRYLLESGVRIYEVRSAAAGIEDAVEALPSQ
jgi:ABC-2 type transport system ATP-binding protein